MKIAFVGAGRLATNLAPALQKAGCEIVEVWSKTQNSAETLAALTSCRASWGKVEAATSAADLFLISVKDSVLPEVIQRLHPGRESALFAHTAGSMPLSLFREAGHERGAVFYPMQTFSKQRLVDFSRVHLFLETSVREDLSVLTSLAARLFLSENIHNLSSAERRKLHLAAVFACNFANHCFALSDEVLRSADIPFEAMLPLIEETVHKLHDLPPQEAQTGPAIRHDENVIGLQRAMLLDRPELLTVYDCLTRSIQGL
ncbi:MAG: DUF2520 domain-containing protein [Bacteroidales bacterium]|nr:DUF2520 domain-containing protein [Bacteroidales bacterium]